MFDQTIPLKYFTVLLASALIACGLPQNSADDPSLMSSPILGDVGMRAARVWCQLSPSYSGEPVTVSVLDSASQRILVLPMTDLDLGNCFEAEITGLEPGEEYGYCIGTHAGMAISDTLKFTTQPLWQYRTDPPELQFLIGSCTYVNEPAYDRPGKPYGGGYGIFETMATEAYDAMIWLGDNIYLREVDFSSLSGFVHRYTHALSLIHI